MNDNDLDQRLRDHGATWRETNNTRTGVDWEQVTGRSRSTVWLAVAGTVAAVAAVVVSLVLVSLGSRDSSAPLPPAAARQGAPDHFFAVVRRTQVAYVQAVSTSGSLPSGAASDRNDAVRAIGVTANDKAAYAAYRESYCASTFQRNSGHSVRGVTTIGGDVAPIAMAVSPDGSRLAFVRDGLPGSGPTGACRAAEQVVVMNLHTHQLRTWSAPSADLVDGLAWSPDSSRIAYLAGPRCLFVASRTTACSTTESVGSWVLDARTAGGTLKVGKPVLGYRGAVGPYAYGPVFWWHGQLAVIVGHQLRFLDGTGGVGPAVAEGFPAGVVHVSSDRTGNHLLLGSGSFKRASFTSPQRTVTYRWDRGTLSTVSGSWTQPGW